MSFRHVNIYPEVPNFVQYFQVYFLYKAYRYDSLSGKIQKFHRVQDFYSHNSIAFRLAFCRYKDDTCRCEQNVHDHLYIFNKNDTVFLHNYFRHHENFERS